MATAALINPTPPAYPHHSPFSFSQPQHHQPPPPMPGMAAPSEGRTSSTDNEPSQRQSLPSISEVFLAAKPNSYSPTTTTSLPGPQSAPPPPFHPSSSRTEPPQEPRPVPPPLEDKFLRYSQRSESGSSHGPPSSLPYPEQRELTKPPEPMHPSVGHANPPPPPHSSYPPQPSHLPPGQYPLSHSGLSPRHAGPPYPSYDQPRPPVPSEEEYAMQRNRYDNSTLNRHFEAWGYQDFLNKVCSSCALSIYVYRPF